jgi:GNAT superfamily N-acetyltransferase
VARFPGLRRATLAERAALTELIALSARELFAGDVCHIGRLTVHPDWQGRGLGAALMRHIERDCAQSRRFELFTGSRSAGNIRFYERMGYVRSREQTLSPAVTLVYLEKLR